MDDGRQLFGAVVRTVGLLLLLWGLNAVLLSALSLVAAGLPQHFFGFIRVLYPLLYLFVGLFLMARAESFVTFAYGSKAK